MLVAAAASSDSKRRKLANASQQTNGAPTILKSSADKTGDVPAEFVKLERFQTQGSTWPICVGSLKPKEFAPPNDVWVEDLLIKCRGFDFYVLPSPLGYLESVLQLIVNDFNKLRPDFDYNVYIKFRSSYLQKGQTQSGGTYHVDGLLGVRHVNGEGEYWQNESTEAETFYLVANNSPTQFKVSKSVQVRYSDLADKDCCSLFEAVDGVEFSGLPLKVYRFDPYTIHKAVPCVSDEVIQRSFLHVAFTKRLYDGAWQEINPYFKNVYGELKDYHLPYKAHLGWAAPAAYDAETKKTFAVAVENVKSVKETIAEHIFISFRYPKSLELAKHIQRHLKENHGIRCFVSEFLPGDDMQLKIIENLVTSRMVIVLGTEDYAKKTDSKFSTLQEFQFVVNSQKPFYLIKMCEDFAEPFAQFYLTQAVNWVKASENAAKIGDEMLEQIVEKFHAAAK